MLAMLLRLSTSPFSMTCPGQSQSSRSGDQNNDIYPPLKKKEIKMERAVYQNW